MKEPQPMIVGVAECRVSGDPGSSLITYALGSCIAVAVHDPVAHVGGLLHFMLPDSSFSATQAARNPYMFADTGIPLLLRRACRAGAKKQRLVVRIAGGAQVLNSGCVFNIGWRNYLAARKELLKADIPIHAESVGGTESRTLRLDIGSGRLSMRIGTGKEQRLEGRAGAI